MLLQVKSSPNRRKHQHWDNAAVVRSMEDRPFCCRCSSCLFALTSVLKRSSFGALELHQIDLWLLVNLKEFDLWPVEIALDSAIINCSVADHIG